MSLCTWQCPRSLYAEVTEGPGCLEESLMWGPAGPRLVLQGAADPLRLELAIYMEEEQALIRKEEGS